VKRLETNRKERHFNISCKTGACKIVPFGQHMRHMIYKESTLVRWNTPCIKNDTELYLFGTSAGMLELPVFLTIQLVKAFLLYFIAVSGLLNRSTIS